MILFLSVLLPQMLIPQSIIVIYTLIIARPSFSDMLRWKHVMFNNFITMNRSASHCQISLASFY